nr:MAG TPA: hypothetical protein [Caudoviricetes sp.]
MHLFQASFEAFCTFKYDNNGTYSMSPLAQALYVAL